MKFNNQVSFKICSLGLEQKLQVIINSVQAPPL